LEATYGDDLDEDGDDDNNRKALLWLAYCEDDEFIEISIFKEDKGLRLLWAAVQTELLTYRRLAEGDAWVSENFDMTTLLESLRNGEDNINIGLVRKSMMKPVSDKGDFRNGPLSVLRAEDVSMYYFANMDDWSRTTFLEEIEHEW